VGIHKILEKQALSIGIDEGKAESEVKGERKPRRGEESGVMKDFLFCGYRVCMGRLEQKEGWWTREHLRRSVRVRPCKLDLKQSHAIDISKWEL